MDNTIKIIMDKSPYRKKPNSSNEVGKIQTRLKKAHVEELTLQEISKKILNGQSYRTSVCELEEDEYTSSLVFKEQRIFCIDVDNDAFEGTKKIIDEDGKKIENPESLNYKEMIEIYSQYNIQPFLVYETFSSEESQYKNKKYRACFCLKEVVNDEKKSQLISEKLLLPLKKWVENKSVDPCSKDTKRIFFGTNASVALFNNYEALVDEKDIFTILDEEEEEKRSKEYLRENLRRDRKGDIKSELYNLNLIMENDVSLKNMLGYNEFKHCIFKNKPTPWDAQTNANSIVWTDADTTALKLYISNKYGVEFFKSNVEDMVSLIARHKKIHPLRDKLSEIYDKYKDDEGLENSIENLLGYAGIRKTKLNNQLIMTWMLGAVARAFKSGCKFDYMLCLIGPQGINKSTFIGKMAINYEWFSDNLGNISTKEAGENIQGIFVCEVAENIAFKKADNDLVKSFITRQDDRYREPYDKMTSSHLRSCVFAVTTNNYFMLKDRTGSRRFLPLDCEWEYKDEKKNIFSTQAQIDVERAYTYVMKYFFEHEEDVELLVLPKWAENELKVVQEDHSYIPIEKECVENFIKQKEIDFQKTPNADTQVFARLIVDELRYQEYIGNYKDEKLRTYASEYLHNSPRWEKVNKESIYVGKKEVCGNLKNYGNQKVYRYVPLTEEELKNNPQELPEELLVDDLEEEERPFQ